MEKLSSVIFFFVFTISSVFGEVVEPFLSLRGNKTVVVFLDLHHSYHDNGSCSYPDWRLFEVAYSLEWKTISEQGSGLEIYDTCGSTDRTLTILRQRFLQDTCNETETAEISGVLSYVSNDTSSLISNTVSLKGVPYMDVRSQALTEAQNRVTKSLVFVLNQVHWTYITTITDDSDLSVKEHAVFLSLVKENSLCVQYSMGENMSEISLADIKTPGIVVFISDLTEVRQLLKDLPPKYGLIIVTHDRKEMELNLTNKVLILRDGFSQIYNFSTFMVEKLSDLSNNSNIMRDYFLSRHNCSWNASAEDLVCANNSDFEDYFTLRSSEFDINTALYALDILSNGAQNASSKDNITDRGQVAFSSFQNGGIIKSMSFSLDSSSNSSPDISQIVNSMEFQFPKSQCDGWCPSCIACSGDVVYDGEYRYFPGDFLVTGVFPIHQKGNHIFQCGSVSFNEFSDIYAAAFQFALTSAQLRSPGLLPNVTIGGLIFDTCSDPELASKTLLNFESCLYSFAASGNNWSPNPQIVEGYVVPQYASIMDMKTFSGLEKLGIGVHPNGAITLNSETIYEPSRFNYSAVIQLLKSMGWAYVGLVTSAEFDKYTVEGFLENTLAKNICIAYNTEIVATNESSIHAAINVIRKYPASVVIFFAKSDAVRDFFRSLTYKPMNKVWILVETRDDYLDFISPPAGSLVFQKKGMQNTEFNQYYAATPTGNPWQAIFNQARDACVTPECKREVAVADTWMRASDIIKSVDIVLHAVHSAYTELCPALEGLCPPFLDSGARLAVDKISYLEFEYQGELVRLNDTESVLDSYTISNVQTNGLVQIGSWSLKGLVLDKSMFKFYTIEGVQVQRNVDSYCSAQCNCINNYTVENTTGKFEPVELDPEMGFVDSSSEFNRKLWSIIVIIIALSGCVVTMGMMMYILCKVCTGALVRRYLILGILLLIGMIFLFLSVLPFVFTPSEVGCGMRFFAHGFSYAFCYAVMLTKMTSLRDYKYIGLGGDISRLNQLLSVFFITGVQIAIGVQWWVLGGSMLVETTITEKTEEGIQNITYYACDFDRKDFIAYHSYVMFLLIICCFYSISVRKETNNMKEARLLLVCSWFCLALWIALVVTFLILKREYLEPIAAIGLLANALSMMVFIYLPKLTLIARLKYEISEKGGKRMENGYKIDTDFQFERPYSLPGTMHSTFTDKTTTLPRSLAAFDSSLSY